MATCADCVHVEVCEDFTKAKLSPKRAEELLPVLREYGRTCDHFKDRAQFVELPCRVGDKVYFNNVHLRYARVIAIYIDASGGMFDLDITTNIATATGYEHFINKDYTFEDIGRRLFLTSEEAEQALKEREKNGHGNDDLGSY